MSGDRIIYEVVIIESYWWQLSGSLHGLLYQRLCLLHALYRQQGTN